jgi:hypothetical protein
MVVAALAVAGLVLAGAAAAEGPRLAGTVGPGFSILLRDAAGNAVTQLDPGPHELVVDDLSEEHNFHLTGPGVDVSTVVAESGQQSFQLTLQNGRYRFVCDAHPTQMRGELVAGTPPPAPPPPPPVPPPPIRLVVTAGPGGTIVLRSGTGAPVKRLRAGRYRIEARDRSAALNVHLTGAGIDRKTSVPFRGVRVWVVTLRKGTLSFRSDPQRATLKGSVPVA